MVALADALVINIGTINTFTFESMKLAGVAANKKGFLSFWMSAEQVLQPLEMKNAES
jgi:hypothetical protein